MRKLPLARNHPSQVAKRPVIEQLFESQLLTDEVDDRATPDWLFRQLDDVYHFTVDAAAAPHNAKCERFWSLKDSGLDHDWSGHVVWCNPPYSALLAWVRKAHESPHATVVMLLPANRTEQPFWQDYIEPYREKGGERVKTDFLRGRLRFGGLSTAAPFASVLVVWKSCSSEAASTSWARMGFDESRSAASS